MATSQPPLTLDDINDPTGQRLHTYLRTLSSRLVAAETELARVKSTPTTQLDSKLVDQLTVHVSQQLSADGAHPLSLTGLTGQAGTPQIAGIIPFSTDPTTTINANLYKPYTMATFGAHIYYVSAANPHTWVTIV